MISCVADFLLWPPKDIYGSRGKAVNKRVYLENMIFTGCMIKLKHQR
jgi:hypothetical protein